MNEIKLRSVEIYPNVVQPFSVQDNQHLRDAYIKGAEEWFGKGQESMDFYVTERSRLIDDNNALIEEKEELAARVKALEEERDRLKRMI